MINFTEYPTYSVLKITDPSNPDKLNVALKVKDNEWAMAGQPYGFTDENMAEIMTENKLKVERLVVDDAPKS